MLHFLLVLFLLWLALATLASIAYAFKAFGRALDRKLPPDTPPRNLQREHNELRKHEAHMKH